MPKKIRVLIGKPGLDGHDVGAKVVARELVEAGMEVIYTGLHQRLERIVNAAIQEDVDCIGLSILSGAHLEISQKLLTLLRERDAGHIVVIVGGNIPHQDRVKLSEMGVTGVFPTGCGLREIVSFIEGAVRRVQPQALPPSPPEKVAGEKDGELKEVVLESGIEVKTCYTPADIADLDYAKELGDPGKYPFTRGIHPQMYRKRPWTMRQYAGFATPAESNRRFKYLIEQGQTGLNVAFDLPTQMGLDSDDPFAEGEVGRLGMAVSTLRDFEEAFADIPLGEISTSLTINSVATVMIAMYAVVAEKQGIARENIRGTAQNDILKEYIGRGTWIFPVRPSIKLIGDTIEYCAKYMPNYYPVSVCGYHIRESGANPVQEMAYAFAIARAYIDHALKRGLEVDDFVSRISFNFDIHGNFFEQVAKFRAGRKLWAKIMKDEYDARDFRSMQLKMIAGGGGGGLTIAQPENNIVRGAYYALISALSGTQTMALCSYDEAYTIPTEKAALISLRTMQILADEMGLRDTADPLAGSYYVESLTMQMERLIAEEMRKVGDIVTAIETGSVQNEVSRQAHLKEKMIERGKSIKVGVNKYEIAEETRAVELHKYEPALAQEQVRKLQQVKRERDGGRVERALEDLRKAAGGEENLMPYMMEAVRSYATVGEITSVLKKVYGEFQEPVRL